MPVKNAQETGLEYESLYAQNVVMTTAIQAHTYQPSREPHSCLTGTRQKEILGNKNLRGMLGPWFLSICQQEWKMSTGSTVMHICPPVSWTKEMASE